MNPSAKRRSPHECFSGQESNTIKRLVTNKRQFISEAPEVELTGEDFESGQNSSIMVRERTRGSKLEGAFKTRKGTLIEHSIHTITFLPAGRTKATNISKRDVGYDDQQPCCSKWPMRRIKTKTTTAAQENKSPTESDMPTENEMPRNSVMANQPTATSDKEPMKIKTLRQNKQKQQKQQ